MCVDPWLGNTDLDGLWQNINIALLDLDRYLIETCKSVIFLMCIAYIWKFLLFLFIFICQYYTFNFGQIVKQFSWPSSINDRLINQIQKCFPALVEHFSALWARNIRVFVTDLQMHMYRYRFTYDIWARHPVSYVRTSLYASVYVEENRYKTKTESAYRQRNTANRGNSRRFL